MLFTMRYTAADRENITWGEKMLHEMYTPLLSGVKDLQGIGSGFSSFFEDKSSLNAQIDALEEEVASLKMEINRLQEYREEIERLRALLALQEEKEEYRLLAARVIARSPNNWYRFVTINKGSNDGIRKDLPVINKDGLVGRVTSVNQNSARVFLLSDREIAVGATIQRTRETQGIVEGLGQNRTLNMINIPYYSEIEEGDLVITSGLSLIYPRGLMIGTATDITKEPNGLLLTAKVLPAVDFNKLEEVMVIIDYNPEILEE